MAFARTIAADQKNETSRIHVITTQVPADTEAVQFIETEESDILWMMLDNAANAAISYVKLYNTVGAVLGTTYPNMTIGVPASARRTIFWTGRLSNIFTATIGFACVTAAALSGATAPGSALNVEIAVREPEE